MTGFAALTGAGQGVASTWELRSVNARGLDLRLRIPDSVPGLDAALREKLNAVVARGNLTLTLRLDAEQGIMPAGLDPDGLDAALDRLDQVNRAANAKGIVLAPTPTHAILGMSGVMRSSGEPSHSDALKARLLAEAETLIAEFLAMRAGEGAVLQSVLCAQIDEIATLTEAAQEQLPARRDHMAVSFSEALARVSDGQVDPDRLAQEMAVLAVKADVAEEIDRLRAHVTAARGLLEEDAPVGRRLDFLTQEFNREANTLCSKSQFAPLTAIGLDLKTLIDRFREQVQNVE